MIQNVGIRMSLCIFRRVSVWAGNTAILPVSLNCARMISTSNTLDGQRKMVRRDKKRRQCVADWHDERLLMKAVAKSKMLPLVVREDAKQALQKQPRDASITRVRMRCYLTGRPRAVLGRFRISRIKFRELAEAGQLAGITRSTW